MQLANSSSVQFSSFRFTSLHFTSVHFISLHFSSVQFISFHFTSLQFISFHFTSVQFSSLRFVCCVHCFTRGVHWLAAAKLGRLVLSEFWTNLFQCGGSRWNSQTSSSLELSPVQFVWCVEAHSCVEKAGMISLVKMRELEIDDDFSLRGPTLQKAIEVCSATTSLAPRSDYSLLTTRVYIW